MSAFSSPRLSQSIESESFDNQVCLRFVQKDHICKLPSNTFSYGSAYRKYAAIRSNRDYSNDIQGVSCEYYSCSTYSQPGMYDYYFEIWGPDNSFAFPVPYVCFDLYLPTDTGLVDGHYTLSNGEVCNAFVFTNYYDYLDAFWDHAPLFIVEDAEFTLETVSAGAFNFKLVLTGISGKTVTITKSDVALVVEENTYNPHIDDDTDDIDYRWEPVMATTINFTAASCNVEDYIEDEGNVWVRLVDANQAYKLYIELFLYALDANGNIPAGTYPVSNSQAANTIWASPGGDDDFDFGIYLLADRNACDVYHSVYYIVSGSLDVAYDAQGNQKLSFNGTTYNGSTIQVTYSSDVSDKKKASL